MNRHHLEDEYEFASRGWEREEWWQNAKRISREQARRHIVSRKIKDGDNPCNEKKRAELTGVSRSQWDRLTKGRPDDSS